MVDAKKRSEAMPVAGAPAESREAIARARAGESEAWGELYREYAPAVFRLCRRVLPTREDAEDATMEILLKVRDKFAQYDPGRPFHAWLFKVAANHCWDLLRRRRVRQDLELPESQMPPLEHPSADLVERLAAERTSQEVRAALAKLPARARMALVLRYYSELSYDEIAQVLGIRRPFVGVVLLRARHQLRELLEQSAAAGRREPRAGGAT